MKNIYRNIVIGVLILAIFGIATKIIHNTDKSPVKKIKIGVIIPLSGEGAQFGEELKNGIETALTINGLRTSFEMIYEDGKIDPKTSLSAFQKLSSVNKVNIIIGPFGPNPTLAIAPVLHKEDILFATSLCDDRFKKYPQIFCIYPSLHDQVKSFVPTAKKLNIKKVALITEKGELGTIVKGTLEEYQKEGGYTLITTEYYKKNAEGLDVLATKIKASGADTVFIASMPDVGSQLVKQLYIIHYTGKIFAGFDATNESLSSLGKASEGVYRPGQISHVYEKSFTDEYVSTYSSEPTIYSALGASVIQTIAFGLSNGKKDSLQVNSVINQKLTTAITGFLFNSDHTVFVPIQTMRFINGKETLDF